MAVPQTDTVSLGDGTTMQLARVPEVDDTTWDEMKVWLGSNPEVAKNLQKFAKDPDAVRGFLQTQAIAEHYTKKLESKDTMATDRMKALENDPELAHVFKAVKEGGMEAAMKFLADEELMLKFSQKMGGLPDDLKPVIQKISDTPLNFHEAAKMGDLRKCQEFLAKNTPIDVQDLKGITPLGYAIGANRIAVVKLLLDSRANPHSVDASGNCGLHYAAGYGRKELVEYLIRTGSNVNQQNANRQTPITVAMTNRHSEVVSLLQAHGATS